VDKEERRLSGAGGSEQDEVFAWPDIEVYIAKGDHLRFTCAIDLRQAAGDEDREFLDARTRFSVQRAVQLAPFPLNLGRFTSASVRTESHYAAAAALPKIKASWAASSRIFRPLQRSEQEDRSANHSWRPDNGMQWLVSGGLRLDQKTPGTGQGLALAMDIAKAYGGSLTSHGFKASVVFPNAGQSARPSGAAARKEAAA
jgi:hypothetical protein